MSPSHHFYSEAAAPHGNATSSFISFFFSFFPLFSRPDFVLSTTTPALQSHREEGDIRVKSVKSLGEERRQSDQEQKAVYLQSHIQSSNSWNTSTIDVDRQMCLMCVTINSKDWIVLWHAHLFIVWHVQCGGLSCAVNFNDNNIPRCSEDEWGPHIPAH